MASPHIVNAKFSIRPERRDEFITIILRDQKKTLAHEKLALHFVVGEDMSSPNTFYLHEEYLGKEGYNEHCKQPHFQAWAKFCDSKPWAEGGEPVPDFYCGTHEPKEVTTTKSHSTFCIHAEYCIKPERRDEFLKVAKNTQIGGDVGGPLSTRYIYGESNITPNCFYFYEEYNEDAHDEHQKSDHYLAWKKFVESNPFTKTPVINSYRPIIASPYIVNAKFSILPERISEFISVILYDQRMTLANEKLALHFVVGKDMSSPNTFYLHEEYLGKEGYDEHIKQPHFQEWAKFCDSKPWAEGGEPVPDFYFGTHEPKEVTTTKSHSTFCIHAEYCIKSDLRDEFLKVAKNTQIGGNVGGPLSTRYIYGESNTTRNCFYFYEEYNEDAHDEHQRSDHYTLWKKFVEGDPFIKTPVINSYRPIIEGSYQHDGKEFWKKADGSVEEILDIEDEPRHHIDFGNPYARVITIKQDPNDTTLAHRHTTDTVIFVLMHDGVKFINDVMGSKPKEGYMKFGGIGFGPYTKEPCVHKITNLSKEEMYIVNVEIFPNPKSPLIQDKPYTDVVEDTNHTLVMTKNDNNCCRVYKLHLEPGECINVQYEFFYIRVVFKGTNIETTLSLPSDNTKDNGNSKKKVSWNENHQMGDTCWKEPFVGTIRNASSTDVYEAYICELI